MDGLVCCILAPSRATAQSAVVVLAVDRVADVVAVVTVSWLLHRCSSPPRTGSASPSSQPQCRPTKGIPTISTRGSGDDKDDEMDGPAPVDCAAAAVREEEKEEGAAGNTPNESGEDCTDNVNGDDSHAVKYSSWRAGNHNGEGDTGRDIRGDGPPMAASMVASCAAWGGAG
jgi:hypothetical protein